MVNCKYSRQFAVRLSVTLGFSLPSRTRRLCTKMGNQKSRAGGAGAAGGGGPGGGTPAPGGGEAPSLTIEALAIRVAGIIKDKTA